MSSQHTSPNSDVVILTAIPIEYKAVRSHLSQLHEVTHPHGNIYECGIFTTENQTWDVVIIEIGAGDVGSALAAERAISYFRPAILFFVGVAGGLKDVEIGDVVVASKVYAYESGKVSQRFEPVPEIWRASYGLEQRAVEVARNRKWLARLDKNHLGPMPRVFIGALAAGEKIISSRQSIIYQLLRASYADALAVEMEGFGFLQVAHANRQVLALIIRGISDLIDVKAEADAANTQEIAAYHAAAFAFEVLANYSLPDQKDLEGKDTRNFGKELRKLRLRAGLAQQELADAVDVSPKTIARWEAGDFVPRRELLRNMIAFFLSGDVFTKGKELEEAESFGGAAFDANWFGELLKKKTTSSPITVFYSYAREDESYSDELEKYLIMLQRQGFITEWHHRRVVPGTDWTKEIDPYLVAASVILLLVSPDFLASDYIYSVEIAHALERHKANESRVIPIILRPVDWFDAPFVHLQALPRDAKPISTSVNRDEAFLDISKGIRFACEELSNSKFILPEFGFSSQPPRFYQLYEVFIKSGVPKITFVEREDFELLKLSLAQPGRGVVIEGPSGIGKTTAVEKAVEALVSQQRISTAMQILSARNEEHRNRLQTIREWHTGTIIIDDFHRLDIQLKNELIDYLKYLADTEPLSKKLVIVGIPQTGQTLVDTSFDIATRIDVFKLSLVNDELLLRMIEKGEEALNIKFDRKAEIVLAASGSLNIAQFLCFNICYRERFIETQERLRVVSCDIDAAVNDVLANLSRKFRESIRRFAAIGGPKNSITLMLLEELASSEDGFLSLPTLKDYQPRLAHGIERFLTEGWMNKLYSEYPACANHLFFDQTAQAIVIDDPQFAFYLKKIRLSTLSKEVGKGAALAQRKVFISYSHKDARWLERLRVHLSPIERGGIIDLWDDTKIVAGAQWKEAILRALESARVAVALVSANFLASDFISQHELPTLLSRASSEGTMIIPIIVSPCLFLESGLSTFQAVNAPDRPLSAMTVAERERVLVKVAEAIRKRLVEDEA